ncbi:hypothetical protein GCM10007304_09680 [Rhodococcoides trifolii]|uniref:Uncharacterized protein n=1 Tax=Rhodococcoides trifolii TaxID=908250 RepID=A0A917CTL7_9NOCA|nr:hypothetical protein GCM10007304_09680 [Rhodococcus trifolii]
MAHENVGTPMGPEPRGTLWCGVATVASAARALSSGADTAVIALAKVVVFMTVSVRECCELMTALGCEDEVMRNSDTAKRMFVRVRFVIDRTGVRCRHRTSV